MTRTLRYTAGSRFFGISLLSQKLIFSQKFAMYLDSQHKNLGHNIYKQELISVATYRYSDAAIVNFLDLVVGMRAIHSAAD